MNKVEIQNKLNKINSYTDYECYEWDFKKHCIKKD